MTKTREWPVKVIYMLIAAALAISLIIMAAPTQRVSANPGLSEWTKVSTPSAEDWVLAPDSTIIDVAVAEDGGVAYAIVDGWNYAENKAGSWLLKSTDSAATWKDITDALEDVDDAYNITALERVATDGVDADFVAVALREANELRVYISNNGGETFENAGEVEDGVALTTVYELAVSITVAGKREIAIGGTSGTVALIFRSKVTGDSAGAWEDARYTGWVAHSAVVDIKFAPSWAADKTILVATANNTAVLLQCGSFGTSEGWNKDSSLAINAVTVADPVKVTGLTAIPWSDLKGITAGIATPLDYSGRNSNNRYVWVNVNYLKGSTKVGKIFRVKNTEVKEVIQQIEDTPWLTNVSYLGHISEGKAIAGVLGDGMGGNTVCCVGVDVYRNSSISNMDICCREWDPACKPPTGISAMRTFYVSEDKAYAVALGGSSYDEGAWSVSFDDGDTWNQISLVDTWIDYLSDVAVSPDCNKTMLVSVNLEHGCSCDSVWLKADDLAEAPEYSDKWLRTWCGQLGSEQYGLLRLAPEETNGDTVYLVDRGTDKVYWNEIETLACWHPGSGATVDEIVDLALKDKETIYALDKDGSVAMSDDYAVGWQDEVDSKVDNGWTIAVKGDDILVGGQDGDVSHSSDGGETFTELEEVPTIEGYVTVAFDSYFDLNDTIYAATIEECSPVQGGVYRWVIDDSDEWKDLGANNNYGYTGLVLGRNPGNPMSNKDFGGVLYASYVGETCDSDWSEADDWFDCWKGAQKCWSTGVARCLTPAGEITCEKCIEWDYLTVGLTDDEYFVMMPQALKICGCLEPTTSTKLFAIGAEFVNDTPYYDVEEAKHGTVWTFEDCYAKKAPTLISPANNTTIPADCYCHNLPFTLKWDAVCDACYYDVQIALDDKFTNVIDYDYVEGVQDELGATALSFVVPEETLTCEVTYYWRVRAHQAETCQIIHSWWSDAGFITIAPSAEQAAITLVAPIPGDTGIGTKNVGFSWNLLADANKFDWVLSKNADLSAPVESKNALTNRAYTCTKPLEYGTTYYWQVTAWKNGTNLGKSAIGTFTTAAQGPFCCPIDGLCFETEALLKTHTADAHPAQPATPSWVWVVIAIGAVLVIVVIVLIFRTRRV